MAFASSNILANRFNQRCAQPKAPSVAHLEKEIEPITRVMKTAAIPQHKNDAPRYWGFKVFD